MLKAAFFPGILCLILDSVLCTGLAEAAELKGMKFPDTIQLEGKTLRLNGLGMRQATIFHVDVYVGALYLESRSANARAILASAQSKRVEMAFVRDVGADKIVEAWNKSFKENCHKDCAALNPQLEKLDSLMTDVKKGDRLTFDFLPSRVVHELNGKKLGTFEGAHFAEVLLSSWIGPNPPNEGLKKGMLAQQ